MKLASKIVALLAVVTVGVLGTYAAVEITVRERDLREESGHTHRLLLGNAVPALSNAVWNLDKLAAKAAIEPFFDDSSILSLEIYSPEGTPFLKMTRRPDGGVVSEKIGRNLEQDAHDFEKRFGRTPQDSLLPYTESALANVGEAKSLSATATRVIASLWFVRDEKPNFVGHAVVEYSTEKLLAAIRELRVRILMLSAILGCSILFFSFVFLRFFVVRRIRNLEGASIKVAAGEWTTVAHETSRDEIGALTRNFNMMVQNLASNVRDIEKKSAQLANLAELIRDFSLQVDVLGVATVLGKKIRELVSASTLLVVSFENDFLELRHFQGIEKLAITDDFLQSIAAMYKSFPERPTVFFECGAMRVYVLERGQSHNCLFVVFPVESCLQWNDAQALFAKSILDAAQRSLLLLDGIGERARIDAEFAAASAVQTTLLPKLKSFPGFEIGSHYQSASTMGGDWFGFHFDENRKRLYFLIGDVTGHGIPSALVTGLACGGVLSSVYQMVHKEGENTLSVSDGLKEMANVINHIIYTTGREADCLMTMLFCCIDSASKEAFFLNGGHNHPIWAGQGRKPRPIPISGNRMGSQSVFSGDVRSVFLDEGDTIVLYTDGLLENKSAIGEVLPLKNVLDALSSEEHPQATVDEIVKRAQEVWAEAPIDDDVSILAVRWTG